MGGLAKERMGGDPANPCLLTPTLPCRRRPPVPPAAGHAVRGGQGPARWPASVCPALHWVSRAGRRGCGRGLLSHTGCFCVHGRWGACWHLLWRVQSRNTFTTCQQAWVHAWDWQQAAKVSCFTAPLVPAGRAGAHSRPAGSLGLRHASCTSSWDPPSCGAARPAAWSTCSGTTRCCVLAPRLAARAATTRSHIVELLCILPIPPPPTPTTVHPQRLEHQVVEVRATTTDVLRALEAGHMVAMQAQGEEVGAFTWAGGMGGCGQCARGTMVASHGQVGSGVVVVWQGVRAFIVHARPCVRRWRRWRRRWGTRCRTHRTCWPSGSAWPGSTRHRCAHPGRGGL